MIRHTRLAARSAARSRRRTAWSLALCAVAAVLGALQEAGAPPVSADLTSLLQRRLPRRPIEAQLTGGLWYAPFSGPVSATDAPTAPSSSGMRGGADRKEPPAAIRAMALLKTAERHPSSLTLATAGVAYLFVPGGEEAAVSNLEQAARLDRHDPRIASDLAAAYLARGATHRERQTEDLFLAVETANRAVAADPGLREGRFNLALVLEKLGLADEARRTWRAYLSVPPAATPAMLNGWQAEALDHLRELERPSNEARWHEELPRLERAAAAGDLAILRPLAALYGPQVRERAELYLFTWSEAQRRGDQDAAERALGGARALGEALREAGHDPLIADAVKAIDGVAHDRAYPARLAALVQGHWKLAAGIQHRRDRDWQAAIADLRRAARQLRRAGSPLAALAQLHLGICELSSGEPEASLVTLRALANDERYRADLDLQGRVAWTTGLALGQAGEAGASLDAYRVAVERFTAAAEPERVGEVEVRRAEAFHLLGEHALAWQHLESAMAQIDSARSSVLFAEAAELAVALGHPAAALLFQDQVVRQAQATGRDIEMFYALLQRSPIVFRLGEPERAERDLEAAAGLLPRVAEAERPRLAADLARAQAELVQTREPRRAIGLLTQTIEIYRTLHLETLVAPLYLARAQARIAASGDATAIEADLRTSLDSLETRRGRIAEESLRITFLDQSADAYDEILRLLAGQGRSAEAFSYAELARGRALLEATARPAGGTAGIPPQERPLPWAEIQRRLPPGVVLLEYAILDDRLLAWGWTRDDHRFFSIPLGRVELAARVDRFTAAARSGARSEFARLSAGLWPALLAPLSGWLRAGDSLVVVPGGSLQRLPFAALVDPASGHYLIEDRALAMAPSATLYVRSLARFRRLAAGPENLLVLSEPAFDAASFPDLGPLRFAGEEGASIAALYPPGAALHVHGKDATRDLFLARAGDYSIVHFAGHTLLDSTAARRSRLIFAGPEEKAVLGPEEIEHRRLAQTRLVILSACATAAGPSSRSEGMLSLARAFFAAGVPEVIATLWRIDDEPAAYLFVAFHRHLRAGEGVAAALRSAQLKLIASSDDKLQSPASWAAVEAIGGALETQKP